MSILDQQRVVPRNGRRSTGRARPVRSEGAGPDRSGAGASPPRGRRPDLLTTLSGSLAAIVDSVAGDQEEPSLSDRRAPRVARNTSSRRVRSARETESQRLPRSTIGRPIRTGQRRRWGPVEESEPAEGLVPSGTHAFLTGAAVLTGLALRSVWQLARLGGAALQRTGRWSRHNLLRLGPPLEKAADTASAVAKGASRKSIEASQVVIQGGARVVRRELDDIKGGFPDLAEGAGAFERAGHYGRRARRRLRRGLSRLNPSTTAQAMGLFSASLVLSVLFGGAAWLGGQGVIHSRWTRVERVQLLGSERAGLLEGADLRLGGPSLLVQPEQVARQVERHPWVARADVSRLGWGGFSVHVEERRPVAITRLEGVLFLVDGAGLPFKPLERGEAADLPLLFGFGDLIEPGTAAPELAQALALLDALDSVESLDRADVTELERTPDGAFELTLSSDLHVRVGRDAFAARLARLDRLLANGYVRLAELSSIDLDLRDRVLVRSRSS